MYAYYFLFLILCVLRVYKPRPKFQNLYRKFEFFLGGMGHKENNLRVALHQKNSTHTTEIILLLKCLLFN